MRSDEEIGATLDWVANIAMMALARAGLGSSLTNRVKADAVAILPTAAPYAPITAPPIAREGSGKFLVTGWVVVHAGTLADNDGVAWQVYRDGVATGPAFGLAVASTVVGESVAVATQINFSFFDDTNPVNPAVATTYSIEIVAQNNHTSGVDANAGSIFVSEWPG
jgi:hypothetical protein